jgi:2-polyprenyl-3-methyl-5-hydroxy-6-metoxy-1,4-benzoquinol methylase
VRKPTIVIGVPCYREVAPELLEDWMRFAYHCGRRMPGFDFFLAIKTKSEQFRARNAIVEAALTIGADWLLMLDDDMVINADVTQGVSESYGFLEKLIAHDKDICGALYFQRGGACAPVLMAKIPEATGYRFLRDDELTCGLQRVDVAGGGCLLIKMSVFDKLKHPIFAPEHDFGTDIQLCQQAAEAGFEVWADTSIELGHLKNERAIVTSKTRFQHQAHDTIAGDVKQTLVMDDIYSRLVDDAIQWTGYRNAEEMRVYAQAFLDHHKGWKAAGKPDADWYRQFPKERVCRQVWFNTESALKRQMTTYLLSAVSHQQPLDVLDFGCGIGIPAFTFAEKGHRVMALDISGTGTFEFLQWRAKRHDLPIVFHESQGGVPHLSSHRFDAIVAMDCLEHIEDWQQTLAVLAAHLNPGGVLFANNAILDDKDHPEHYDLDGKTFIAACVELDLMPVNQITYQKRVAREIAA